MSLTFPTPTGRIPIYVSRCDVLWLVLVRDVVLEAGRHSRDGNLKFGSLLAVKLKEETKPAEIQESAEEDP